MLLPVRHRDHAIPRVQHAAFARFLAHRRSDAGWVLARFICPVARFGELEPLLAGTEPLPAPLRIAAIGRGGPTLDEFKAGTNPGAK